MSNPVLSKPWEPWEGGRPPHTWSAVRVNLVFSHKVLQGFHKVFRRDLEGSTRLPEGPIKGLRDEGLLDGFDEGHNRITTGAQQEHKRFPRAAACSCARG